MANINSNFNGTQGSLLVESDYILQEPSRKKIRRHDDRTESTDCTVVASLLLSLSRSPVDPRTFQTDYIQKDFDSNDKKDSSILCQFQANEVSDIDDDIEDDNDDDTSSQFSSGSIMAKPDFHTSSSSSAYSSPPLAPLSVLSSQIQPKQNISQPKPVPSLKRSRPSSFGGIPGLPTGKPMPPAPRLPNRMVFGLITSKPSAMLL